MSLIKIFCRFRRQKYLIFFGQYLKTPAIVTRKNLEYSQWFYGAGLLRKRGKSSFWLVHKEEIGPVEYPKIWGGGHRGTLSLLKVNVLLLILSKSRGACAPPPSSGPLVHQALRKQHLTILGLLVYLGRPYFIIWTLPVSIQ